jgi:hypothetical protein
MAYTTVSALKTYLGVVGNTDDALLTALIARAQAIIDAYCGRTFEAAQDSTRKLDAKLSVSTDKRTLYVERDLCAITSITNGDGVSVGAAEYVTEPRWETPFYGITLKRESDIRWTWDDTPEDAITVVGRWAYSATAPADIVQATERLAAYLYRQKDNMSDLDRAIAVNANTTLLPQSLPRDVQLILAPYRRAV